MDIQQKIALAHEITRHLAAHLADIWPGFTPTPFILYDDNNQVAVGTGWPERYTEVQQGMPSKTERFSGQADKTSPRPSLWVAEGCDPQLMGNTSITYHGVRVAIWDTRTWPDDVTVSKAAAGIAHEMFHSFQHTGAYSLWPNELLLPQYPHSARSVALVIEENKLLADILAHPDKAALNRLADIAALRIQREAEIGTDYLAYDQRCESAEGTAAYVEIRVKAAIEGQTPLEAAASYLPALTDHSRLLDHYRSRCYVSGLVLCLAMDALRPEWQTDWLLSQKTLFDWMKDSRILQVRTTERAIAPASIETAGEYLTIFQNEKEARINAFAAQPLRALEGEVHLIGFDPMNLTCSRGRCLHLHGRLRVDDHELLMTTPFLAEYGDTILDVKRIWVAKLQPCCIP